MVLESLVSKREMETKPLEMFAYSAIVTSLSLFAAYIIFPSSASVVSIFLITLVVHPVVSGLLNKEERVEEYENGRIGMNFFRRHEKLLKIYIYYFLGVVFAASFWHIMLPQSYVSKMFKLEIETVKALGNIVFRSEVLTIIFNNIRVMLLAFFVSLIFGSGAIFILGWNAMVVAAYIGNIAETSYIGENSLIAFIKAFSTGMLGIMLHGLPEVSAYCLAGIAGGILSAGIVRKRKLEIIRKDSLILMLIATLLIIISAFLEVYVSGA